MASLIKWVPWSQCEGATELGQNELINELSCDYNYVGF
jgi:hypothetical protein